MDLFSIWSFSPYKIFFPLKGLSWQKDHARKTIQKFLTIVTQRFLSGNFENYTLFPIITQ